MSDNDGYEEVEEEQGEEGEGEDGEDGETSPRRKKARLADPILNHIPVTQGDSANSCPICLDNWSATGQHRLVSLKCGHLFGKLCIEKWLTGHPKCPQCNGPAKKGDVRPIYAKKISAVDEEKMEDAMRRFETEKVKRNHIEKLHLKTSMQCQLFAAENDAMRKRILDLESRLKVRDLKSFGKSAHPTHGCYEFASSRLISTEKRAHVFASDPSSGMLVVSKKHEDSLTNHGVLKISAIDACHHEFTWLHNNQIRDAAFDPNGNTSLLSCSKNRDIRITCMKSNAMVVSYSVPRDPWSCGWSNSGPHNFHCGLQNGEVLVFDVRNTREAVTSLVPCVGSQRCPVISVTSIPSPNGKGGEGYLVSTLQSLTLYQKAYGADQFTGHLLDSPPGAISSVSYIPEMERVLASYKPGLKHPKERHVLMKLHLGESPACEIIQTISGSSSQHLRSRSALIQCPENDSQLLVCAGDQAANTLKIWEATGPDHRLTSFFPCRKEDGPIIAVGPHRAGGQEFLCALTNKRLFQYRWLLSGAAVGAQLEGVNRRASLLNSTL